MKSENSNIKEKDEKQRRNGGNQKSSDYNTKKQVTNRKITDTDHRQDKVENIRINSRSR